MYARVVWLALLAQGQNYDGTYPLIEVPYIWETQVNTKDLKEAWLTRSGGTGTVINNVVLVERNAYNGTYESATRSPGHHKCAAVDVILDRVHVSDGICDCCDGSDEPEGACANRCSEWNKMVAKRNEQITSTMLALQNKRTSRLDMGLKMVDDDDIVDEYADSLEGAGGGTDGGGTHSGTHGGTDGGSTGTDGQMRRTPAKSLLENWLWPAKSRFTLLRNWWFVSLAKLLGKRVAEELEMKPLSENLRSELNVLKPHPEWLYTAALVSDSMQLQLDQKRFTVKELLEITMKETWQYSTVSYGKLVNVTVVDPTDLTLPLPTKYSRLISPYVMLYQGGSRCRDKAFNDDQRSWIEADNESYSARLYTVCAEHDALLWVEFQQPCRLSAVASSPAACVSHRQAQVENLPSGQGRRVKNEL
ncbi:glucosidase II beta subunit-like protein [Gregarina niphandrodes]|uniref:Glucosidase II beta subunit-like protein n=1 Tax=Gregarina niphandrodes TaxID=110365 RepID=A0A023B5L9_GRENI|nr:glucosidase II beta subunit-like protein [Gregarina niphandrodes]EZG61403.1 glucosidase II beta subunit-like protein [Gregarina niphandrodes]|eukprot:XP_011130763.1 glucosidase II beta subunit-like protein [Gregarina niphandrodes]